MIPSIQHSISKQDPTSTRPAKTWHDNIQDPSLFAFKFVAELTDHPVYNYIHTTLDVLIVIHRNISDPRP